MSAHVLIVDDQASMCQVIAAYLQQHHFTVTWFLRAEAAFEFLKSNSVDLVLTDLNLPGINGIDFCERVVSNWTDIPVVVITAFGNMQTAVASLRAGATDFITKPVEMEMLQLTLEKCLKQRVLQQHIRTLQTTLAQQIRPFEEILGESACMKKLYDQLQRIAPFDASVLIVGESGTGKELVAKALHQRSARQQRPFIAINCAALPEHLLESELFGHTKGAFTDAKESRKGLFLEANEGTLFLDEIEEMPLNLQPKLLRALEQKTIRPLGATTEFPFNVRILAATNKNLDQEVQEGRFREDLYFRLNVIEIDIPPLRIRENDILFMAQHFLQQFQNRVQKPLAGFSREFAEKLMQYHWPGNVRELKNVMERAVILSAENRLVVEDLPEKIRAYQKTNLFALPLFSELLSLEALEQQYLHYVLERLGNNKTLAAQTLKIDRKTLYRKLSLSN